METVVLTGAAGAIGSTLREAWRGRFGLLRLVDRRDVGETEPQEEALVLDLADFGAARRAVDGADAVVHLAAFPQENRFDVLLEANIRVTYNVFEASRQAGVRRVVFASTNHVTGFYRVDERVGPDDPVRPDSMYGVTKVFGEAVGRLFVDKWGLEVVCLRIGAFGERPGDPHALPMWLSPGDAVRLFTRSLLAPDVGFLVVYGLSRTPDAWWENPGAALLGYEPVDEVDPEVGRSLETEADPRGGFQGGPFAARAYWFEP